MLIAGDIGGTKTILALYRPESGARAPVAEAEFASADYRGLEPIVAAFLARSNQRAEVACFDVAGPVIGGRAYLTNLPWIVEEAALQRSLGLRRVTLLNDLKAVAYAAPRLLPMERRTINAGAPERNGPLAIIAPGTGLGEAFLIWDGLDYIACASEGGHASFAPADDRQSDMRRFLAKSFGHVSFERVCSGQGIANIYDFLRDANPGAEPPGFAARLALEEDRTPLIAEAAQQDPAGHPLCAQTLEMFVSVLGQEAGNLALKVLATGGVYLAGGIPPRLLPNLTDGRFMHAFSAKGRFGELLRAIPVHVVTAQAALLGAALYGLDEMRRS
jgi:glucokinase